MGLLLWIVLGLAVGAVAEVAMPGPDPLGATGRALLGIGGAIIGGVLGTVLGGGTLMGIDLYASLSAVIGALSVLIGYRCVAIRAME
jgi:uncharacterized membrane protein YeaQ/YmgE (transglycosylase-associated protein family)